MRTPLCDLLGIEHPIVLAPMGGAVGPELAAAVSNAGGLGLLPLTWAPDPSDIREMQALTSRPFGGNLVLEWDQHERLESMLDAGLRIVSLFWGDPTSYVDSIHQSGAIVMHTVGSAEEAKRVVQAGVDVVVAQGFEAGGHVWGRVGTIALVPAVVDAVAPVPVIAAGGIADARGIAAAFTLGAAGVQIGTAYLRCPEAEISAAYRAALESARDDGTTFTNVYTGRPARGLVNRLIREQGPLAAGIPEFPLAAGAVAPLRKAAEQRGSAEFSPVWAGQGAPLARTMPAAELTRTLADEALQLLSGFARAAE